MGTRVLVRLLVAWCVAPVGTRVADGQATAADGRGGHPPAMANLSAAENVRQPRGERIQVEVAVLTDSVGTRRVATVAGAELHAVRLATSAVLSPEMSALR